MGQAGQQCGAGFGPQPGVQGQRQPGAADLAHRRVAPGQRDGPDGPHPHKPAVAAAQKLAAPDGTVRPQAGAVPHDAEGGAFQPVVRHAGGHVGPVVLHLQQRQPAAGGQGLRLPGGGIVGVQVAGQRPRRKAEQAGLRVQRGAVMVQRLGVFQVADVLAQKDVAAPARGEPGFLLGPEGQHAVGPCVGHGQRLGGVAPAAAVEVFPPAPHRRQRVVAAVDDGAVVEQPAVGHALQGLQRAGVIGQHRAAGAVGAGEHQRRRTAEGPVRQQHVQRRVGQQDAEAAVFAEPNGVPGAAGGPLFQQQDGAAGALQQRGLLRREAAQPPGGVQVAAEHRQRLFLAVLAAAQAGHGGGVQGVAGQVDAAGPLDGHDLPRGQRPLGQRDGVAGAFPARRVQKKGPRPAGGAAVGLGMVAAAADVGVFGGAGGAQGEPGHRGVGPVVGQRPQDREPRPAVGAVEEGVAVAPVGGGGQFLQAGGAGGQVGGGQGGRGPGGAGPDGKPAVPAAARQRLHGQVLHHGQRGRRGAHRLHKALDGGPVPLQFQFHPGGGVAGPAGQLFPGGQPVQEGAEPHPLHDAGNFGPHAPGRARPVHTRAARMRPARWAASSSSPSPVRTEVRNSGAPGFTPR